MEPVSYSVLNQQHIQINFMSELCCNICFYGKSFKEWCISNDSQNLNSDSSTIGTDPGMQFKVTLQVISTLSENMSKKKLTIF